MKELAHLSHGQQITIICSWMPLELLEECATFQIKKTGRDIRTGVTIEDLDQLANKVGDIVAQNGVHALDVMIAKLGRLIKTSPFHQHASSDTIPAHNVEPDV